MTGTTEVVGKPAVPTTAQRARLKDGVHIELSPRRVRTYFGGTLIGDSERVLLVFETKRPPVYWFPTATGFPRTRIPLRSSITTPPIPTRWPPPSGNGNGGKPVQRPS